MKNPFFLAVGGLLFLTLQGCTTNGVFEKTQIMPGHAWASDNRLSFTFTVSDTSTFYNLYLVLAHTDAYHYNNIYVNVSLIPPGDTAVTRLKSFQLAKNSYGWLGTAMDDVIDHRLLINEAGPAKLKKGNFTVILQQAMRDDPLAEIIGAGIRAEKVVQ